MPNAPARRLLPSFLKMAAIATIADAVPLRGENRTIAALGLRELRRPMGVGLRALFAAAQLDPAHQTAHRLRCRFSPGATHQCRGPHGCGLRGDRTLYYPRSRPRARTGREARTPESRTPRHRSLRACGDRRRASQPMPNWLPSGCSSSMAMAGIAASSASSLRA